MKPLKVLKIEDVVEITSLGKSTIYALASEGKFPVPIKLSDRASGWLESEVYNWIKQKVEDRDRGATL